MTSKTSYILDTDPWYDPDDLFSLLYLLNSNATIDLIVTGDEVGTGRAELTKWFLEEIGMPEIKVVAGAKLPGPTKLFCQDLLPNKLYDVSGNVADEIAKVVGGSDRTVYMGIQAYSNLDLFQQTHSSLSDKVTLYQMAGSLDPSRKKAEHNVRIDIPAAKRVIASRIKQYLVMADTTLNPKFEVSNQHPLYNFCRQHSNAGIRAIAKNIDQINGAIGYWTFMHDPLTVSAALGHNFVDFYQANVAINDQGLMKLDDRGSNIFLSKKQSRDDAVMQNFSDTIMRGNYK